MNRHRLVIGSLALGFVVGSGLSAWADQERTRPAGAETTGSAVPRGGDSGASAAPRGGDPGGASAGSSTGGMNTGGSMDSPSFRAPAPPTQPTYDPPTRFSDQSSRSRPSGSSSSGRATPRSGGGKSGGGSSPRGNGGTTASSSGGDSSASSGDSAPSRRAVPAYSRPRDGRPVTGVGVERNTLPPGNGNIIVIPGYPYYPYGFWGAGYGYGLGSLYFDPFWYGGYGFGYPGFGYAGGYYGGGGGGYSSSQSYSESGSLRLKIDPRSAQVYVDGYFVGVVDSFDGVFQKLGLEGGGHKVELKADGYEPLEFEVLITPGETVTYKGEMKRIR
jgi:PEGA domain